MGDGSLIDTMHRAASGALAQDRFTAKVVRVSGNLVRIKRDDQVGPEPQDYLAVEGLAPGLSVVVPTHGRIQVTVPLAVGDRVTVQRFGPSWLVTARVPAS